MQSLLILPILRLYFILLHFKILNTIRVFTNTVIEAYSELKLYKLVLRIEMAESLLPWMLCFHESDCNR